MSPKRPDYVVSAVAANAECLCSVLLAVLTHASCIGSHRPHSQYMQHCTTALWGNIVSTSWIFVCVIEIGNIQLEKTLLQYYTITALHAPLHYGV